MLGGNAVSSPIRYKSKDQRPRKNTVDQNHQYSRSERESQTVLIKLPLQNMTPLYSLGNV